MRYLVQFRFNHSTNVIISFPRDELMGHISSHLRLKRVYFCSSRRKIKKTDVRVFDWQLSHGRGFSAFRGHTHRIWEQKKWFNFHNAEAWLIVIYFFLSFRFVSVVNKTLWRVIFDQIYEVFSLTGTTFLFFLFTHIIILQQRTRTSSPQ